LNKVTNLTCEVGGGGIRLFEGNYDYYMWKKSKDAGLLSSPKKEKRFKNKSNYKERKKIRNRLSWIEKRFKTIEKELEKQRSIAESPKCVDDYEKLQKAMETTTELESEYLRLMEEQESLQ
jgi:ATP-binding cassette subfamily F protein 3